MPRRSSQDNDALRRFMRQVWRDDVAPLLRGRRAKQRRKAARFSGKAAAAAGLLVDGALRLKGKPFTRFLTVVGTSFGAMLPDVWDWQWLRRSSSKAERKLISEHVRKRAERLPESDALELFDLSPTATRDDLKSAWRRISKQWHPDHAANDQQRAEFHVRFVAYKSAYERLTRAHDEGRLPRKRRRP